MNILMKAMNDSFPLVILWKWNFLNEWISIGFFVVNEYKIDFYVKQNIESINLSTLV